MIDPRIEAAETAVIESLRETVYTCSRVWEAWQVGTMSEEDFAPAWEDDDLVADIATETLRAADGASIITTVDDLDALPEGSVALGWAVGGQTVYLRCLSARGRLVWGCVGDGSIHESAELLHNGFEARVLYRGHG